MSSPPTTIVLIRHGQTDWNLERRFQGHIDTPLNETGLDQSAALTGRLRHWPIQALYSSDLQRATQTATFLSKALQVTLVKDSNLRERAGGIFEGLTSEEASRQFPDEWRQQQLTGSVPKGAETQERLTQRVLASFQEIVSLHPGQLVAVVTHGGVIRRILVHLLGIPHTEHHRRIDVSANTSLNIVEIDEHGPRLRTLNDTRHLPDHGSWQAVSPWK